MEPVKGTRPRPSWRLPGRAIVAILAFIILFLALGCSKYKTVLRQDLDVLASGIAWYVERVEPQERFIEEERAKIIRVGEKILRNARALADIPEN